MRSEACVTKRIVVLVSGNGGNLQAILDAVDDGRLAARVVGVVSNRPAVRALQRATTAGVPTAVVEAQPAETRVQYDARLRDMVEAWEPDIVVLAGFMRVLSPAWRFDVPIPAGARLISLVAMDAGNGSREDFANWVDAGFMLRK